MSVEIKLNPPEQIVKRLGLDEGGRVQRFFTSEVARLCDPYIPFDTGTLKNTKNVTPTYIHYVSPYAAKQYFENEGREMKRGGKISRGFHETRRYNGLRGKYWDKRMMADKGDQLVQSVENYVRSGRR